MKVLALRADAGGCAFYRVEEPARVVMDAYPDVEIEVTTVADVEATKAGGLTTVRQVNSDADLIIIQRPVDNAFTSYIQQAQRQGIKVIVELDDDLSTVHPNNSAYRLVHPRMSPFSNYEWAGRAAELADLVTVSTPALAKFAPHGRYEVLRNCVPLSATVLDIERPYEPVIGWTGTVQTHPTDLDVTKGAVAAVMSETGVKMRVVGDKTGVAPALQIWDSSKVLSGTGWVPLDQYYSEIRKSITAGIVPLDPGAFNNAKSYLKGLEFAALGIPFVASPTPEYRLLQVHGVGTTAKSPGDWKKALRKLVADRDTTREIGQNQREIVAHRFTYEANAHRWYETWQKLVNS